MKKGRSHHRPSSFPPSRKSSRRHKAKRSLWFPLLLIGCVVTAIAGGAVFSNRVTKVEAALQQQSDAGGGDARAISASALQQIEALISEKESRTPAQQKIDSQLIYAAKMDRGEPVATNVQTLAVDVAPDSQGDVVIDITAFVDDSLLAALEGFGATIISSYPEYHSVRATLPLAQVEAVAGLDAVRFIRPKLEPQLEQERATTGELKSTQFFPPDFDARATMVRERLAAALTDAANDVPPLETNTGKVTSEGDTTHKAARARGTFKVNGTGVKIGVISDGAIDLATAQSTGDLPPDVVVLPGQQGGCVAGNVCDEGTAMLEIIYDLAPGAKLFFATANGGPAAFADNIRKLRLAGCDIIVDDVSYPTVETPFHDGQPANAPSQGAVIMQAVNDVTAAGCLYFSSAGNGGNKNDGTSGVWEGDFVDAGSITTTNLGTIARVNDFDTSAAVSKTNLITGSPSPAQSLVLFWADPLAGAANDYDLYVLNNAGTSVVAAANTTQNGTQDPVEVASSAANVVNNRVVVAKFSGADRFLHVTTGRGRLSFNTPGQTRGHSSAALAYSVAATPAVGPFPNPFSAANAVETFSSDGPRRLFFNADGSAVTPGNFSSTGGVLRQKPDITAADGVSVTGAGNFSSPFFGTSAAAPHAAAIAGLLKSFKPTATQAEIRTALTSSAIDIETPGVDRDAGAGIIMAFEALQAMGATGFANLDLNGVSSSEVGGNANGFIEPGERGRLNVTLANTGLAPATGIMATLTSSTPGVTITPPGTSAYPDIPVNGTATNTTPFEFAVSPSFGCAQAISFTLTVNYSGGESPRVLNFSIVTGRSATISTRLDATPPPAGTDYTSPTTGQQTGRISRSGVASSCDFNKTNPGLTATTGLRQFDSYTFQNTSSAPLCVTITLSSNNGTSIYSATYLGSFTPSNPSANFLGDAGSSSNFAQYAVLVPAGATYVVVVHDINITSAGSGSDYTLQVGLACQAAPANQPPVNTVPGAQTTNENTPLVFSAAGGNQISVADADAGNNPLQVTLTATNGTITLSTTAGLTFTAGDGTADATMTFTGSQTAINAALNGLTFNPTPGFSGAAGLQLTTNDQGFSGTGGARSDTDTVAITVNSGGTLQFDNATYSVDESAGTATITVTRTGGASGVAGVTYTITAGSATNGADFTAASAELQFADGETSKTFTVAILDDQLDEANETINLALSNVTGTATLGAPATAVLTILDNDGTPSLSINDVAVTEGDSGTTNAIFTVTLAPVSGQTVTVNAATADGTATAPSDYTAVSTTLTFAPGETTKTITVPVLGDTVGELDETFFVNLTNPVNATISDGQGVGTINDEEPFVTLQFGQATYTINEEESSVVNVTVTRTGDSSQPVSVNYATSDGTASSRSDYTGTSGRLDFAAGQTGLTIPVLITEDSFVEGTETFTVTLSNPTGNDVALGNPNVATVQIEDDVSEPSTNAIDETSIFVSQQYHDFLNRQPDPNGLTFWVNNIESCGTNAKCREFKRADTSAAFFLSTEFQDTGYFVYRFYQASFNRRIQSTVPLTFEEFQPDTQKVSRGVIIGEPGALEKLEANKQAYASEFVTRPAFIAQYPATMTPEDFVDALNTNTGVSLTRAERDALVAELSANNTNAGRASVLRKVVDNAAFRAREFNRAFVLMQYFGYLRRNPNDAPDGSFSGFNFWLNKLNQFNGDFRQAEMVRAFINSSEYRRRFGAQ